MEEQPGTNLPTRTLVERLILLAIGQGSSIPDTIDVDAIFSRVEPHLTFTPQPPAGPRPAMPSTRPRRVVQFSLEEKEAEGTAEAEEKQAEEQAGAEEKEPEEQVEAEEQTGSEGTERTGAEEKADDDVPVEDDERLNTLTKTVMELWLLIQREMPEEEFDKFVREEEPSSQEIHGRGITHIKVRGDGNCFYYAFLVSLFHYQTPTDVLQRRFDAFAGHTQVRQARYFQQEDL